MFFALFYNVIGIPIAARVLAGLGLVLNPELAGLAMALSSISVVSNSLLLRYFRPRKRNIPSMIAPVVMVLLFSGVFFQFARLSSNMNKAGMGQAEAMAVSGQSVEIANLIAGGTTRVAYAGDTPKLFLAAPALVAPALKAQEGTLVLQDNEMILGSAEAAMMREENLFQQPGDVIVDFFGIPEMRIVGILAPTGTLLDEYHVVNPSTLARLDTQAEVRITAVEGALKLFYGVQVDNVPATLRDRLQADTLNPATLGGRPYVPVVIGAEEAQMMQDGKLFQVEGDLIHNLFGNDMVVAGVLPETNTPLDMMHFVRADVPLKF
jgi:hypothetical protein